MGRAFFAQKPSLVGSKIVLGFSGGPDAAALAYRLKCRGADVIPIYINYRKMSGGGKTAKDLRAVGIVAKLLGLPVPTEIRVPLGNRPKSHRNRFFVKVLASIAKKQGGSIVALGTIKEVVDKDESVSRATINDLDPKLLSRHGNGYGVQVITWDTLGVHNKADEFREVGAEARSALFQTTSCQMWWRLECGNCHSCVSRHTAFMQAFGCDPTLYRQGSRVTKMFS